MQLLEPIGVLRVDHVRGRPAALLLDLGGEVVLVVVLDPDLDARLFGEGGDERVRRLLVLGVVQGERLAGAVAGRAVSIGAPAAARRRH